MADTIITTEGVNESYCTAISHIDRQMDLEEYREKSIDATVKDQVNHTLIEDDNVTVPEPVTQLPEASHHNNDEILGMLNLLPRKRPLEIDEEDTKETHKKKEKIESNINDSNVTPPPRDPTPPNDSTTPSLVQLFKKDPEIVLSLLSKALSMESLSDLLKKEQQQNSAQLKSLREKVEKAHSVLSQCSEQKKTLMEQIEKVTEEIQVKRKQLTSVREDLRELSMEESQLKTKRDTAYEKCSDLRRKVHACREAIQQIQNLYAKKRKGDKFSTKFRQAES